MKGVIPLLKPPGWTSQQAVSFVKRLVRSRAGHAGTLDPDAAGVLPVCVGGATRLAQYLMEAPKGYRFTAVFGIATDTQDASGRVTQSRPAGHLGPGEVEAALDVFRGEVSQVPPMFSAVKRGGRPLYELARRGAVVERQARTVTVYSFRLLDWQAGERPRGLFDLRCSRGTYVRTLIDDLGAALGTGAHLAALLRREAGGFSVADACLPAELREDPDRWLVPPAAALAFLPQVELTAREADGVRRGGVPAPRPSAAAGAVRLVDPRGQLVAVARVGEAGRLAVERVLA